MKRVRAGDLKFPRSRQRNTFACGARSVFAILKKYGHRKKYKLLEQELGTTPENGTLVEPMVQAFRSRGLSATVSTKTTLRQLTEHFRKGVAVLHVDGDHFIAAHARRGNFVYIMDPMGPPDKISLNTFRKRWKDGWAILVSP